MAPTKTYTARASREGKWWVIAVEGLGVTQARNLREADEMVKSLICLMDGVPECDVAVTFVYELDPKLRRDVDRARKAADALVEQQKLVGSMSRKAATALVKAGGMSGRDAAAVLGVSPQRISQLLKT